MRAIERVDDDEPGLRILAEVIQAVADRERDGRPTLRVVEEGSRVIPELIVSHRDWLHGLVKCPCCGLPVDARDASELKVGGWDGQTRYVVPEMTHRRCGETFTLVIDREAAS